MQTVLQYLFQLFKLNELITEHKQLYQKIKQTFKSNVLLMVHWDCKL